MRHDAPKSTVETVANVSGSASGLLWRVHLLRRAPRRLPVVLLTLLFGALCIWLIFGTWLPVAAALLLLVGATGEYLFPITYRIGAEGVRADALTSHQALRWSEAKRCVIDRRGLLLSPLPAPSRLDSFRGVFLRYAPKGQPGDRATILAEIARHAPGLLPQPVPEPPTTLPAPPKPQGAEPDAAR